MTFAKSVAVAIAVVQRDSLIAVWRGGYARRMLIRCRCDVDAMTVEYRYLIQEDWSAKEVYRGPDWF
jgi:hypothetical protein